MRGFLKAIHLWLPSDDFSSAADEHFIFSSPTGVASFLLHPHQVKVPLAASLSCISFLCMSEGGSPRRVFPLGQE